MTLEELEDEIIIEAGNDGEIKVEIKNQKQSKGHSELVFRNDTIRKNSDIRNMPDSELTWYQKQQLEGIKKRVAELEPLQRRKKIFATFDFTATYLRNLNGGFDF